MCQMRDSNRVQEYLDDIQFRTEDLNEALDRLKELLSEILFLKDDLVCVLDGLVRNLQTLRC